MSQTPYPPTQPEPSQPPAGGHTFSQYPQQPYPQQDGYGQPSGSQQFHDRPGQPYQVPSPGYGMAMVPQGNPYAPQALAPYGVDPLTGLPYSDKSKLVAGLLQIFLGGLGIGRFYLGNAGVAIAQIVVTFVTFGFGALWPLIDGIVLLAGQPRDRAGRPLRP
ncbi:TM2 domain-containing protein [Micropruina sp.]|uniref:TM2 domain-containing protein n=1 Tax=Micropruina sp. TaxID=2737536 RepID=UPI0039E58A0C